MKRILYLLVLICTAGVRVNAQVEPPCSEISYTYIDKSTVPLSFRCSTDGPPYPLSDTQANMPLTMCLDPDLDLNDARYRNKVCDPALFKERTEAALLSAINSWMSVCKSNELDIHISNNPSNCDVQIRPIVDEKEFTDIRNGGTPISNPRIVFAQGWPGGVDIKGTYHNPIIQLAFTNTIYEDIEEGDYTNIGAAWSASGCDYTTGSALCPGEIDKRCIDMETVLLHELGHILGIGHPDEAGCVSPMEKPYPSKDAMTPAGLGERRSLSKRDKCAICAVYCADDCDNLASIIELTDEGINLYPNPATNVLNISCKAGTAIRAVKIIDGSGRLLISAEMVDIQSTAAVSIADLVPGTYFVVIVNDAETVVKILQVQQ